ncbi:class I SAM-dependent methyltransferase [Roseovarius sp. B08]|uniref:class I SAM-dependent methyltransferase n=1 Tax=Roseovarius sp. B08 TaxID=3449223 RepID=UPI003EDC8A31
MIAWPEGARVAVFAPRTGADLSALPKDRTQIITRLRPDWEAFQADGWDCVLEAEGRYGAAVVFATRAKALCQGLIAEAASVSDGIVVVDGAKTDGIESILKACRKRAEVSAPLSKAHGKLFSIEAGADFSDWALAERGTVEEGGRTFVTAPGVFSADGVDPASRQLADALPEKLGAQVVDLGAGWGYLAHHVLSRESVQALHLVEADHVALGCARQNVGDARAVFHWADALNWSAPGPMDAVVMNPPFHIGRASDPELGRAFIRAAARMLSARGQLYMVANRHLPYEGDLAANFGDVREIGGDTRFKIVQAARPSRTRG